ncbi:MAG: hypothetical protein MJ224_00290 [archaeon]|nr:hypothetical protein [archaeon]
MSLLQALEIRKLKKEIENLNNLNEEYMIQESCLFELKLKLANCEEYIKSLEQENKDLKNELKLAAAKLIIKGVK